MILLSNQVVLQVLTIQLPKFKSNLQLKNVQHENSTSIHFVFRRFLGSKLLQNAKRNYQN